MILHVDMDAFFAAVEQRDNPALAGQCVVVGGLSGRGVVAAASYEARAWGVRSAMPISRARRLCPRAIFVKPRLSHYQAISKEIMAVLGAFSPLVQPVSVDEAYLDISGSEKLQGQAEAVGRQIKAAVAQRVGLPCSVGGAPVRFLAKVASGWNKPDGLTIITPGQSDAVIRRLPVEAVPGVGPVARRRLSLLGICTLGEVRKIPEPVLVAKLGKFGHRLLALANGQDDSPVVPPGRPKSLSAETTLPQDTRDCSRLEKHLLRQAEDVSRQLRHHQARARVVVLKLKDAAFCEKSRQSRLPAAISATTPLYRQARELLAKEPLSGPVRLIGLGVSALEWSETGQQLELFSAGPVADQKWQQVERAIDDVSDKFGPHLVQRASLTGKKNAEKDINPPEKPV